MIWAHAVLGRLQFRPLVQLSRPEVLLFLTQAAGTFLPSTKQGRSPKS